ncbi:MAG TPA: peptidyl-prolyl cis-trans isomerase [Vicinamibacterales bacterium]|nr:peptidyl-prolyl cis-trans isomerase [Vicinamibacterales bacterium]
MTMLDRMRRHRNWLKWSLALVVLAFILLYIPDFFRGSADGAGLNDAVATVDGQDITVSQFRRAYQRQMQQYRASYGANMDERMLKQLGIDQRIVQQLVEEEAAVSEARRLDITASDAEVTERILAIPAFQENGQFIGYDKYRQMLQMQEPPVKENEFEEQVRRSITVEKLQAALTNWITVPDAELTTEFKKRNEKVKLAVVSFPADKFREGAQASDAEVTAWFEAHKNDYKVPEKRKVRYALIDMQAIRDRVQVSPQDVQRNYEDNQQQYATPEQVRASHILLKTEGKDDAAVKTQAEELAAKAKGGADFAELAKKFSQDDSNNSKGGDLDFFGKGQMVPEFDAVAFTMKPGDVSDVVKTQFGYHVIKLVDKRAASQRPLAEVQAQITDQIKWQRAQDEAQRTADDVASKLKKPADFDTVAKPRGLTVAESGFFSRDEPIAGLGMAPAAAESAFELKDGDVSDAIRTPQGFAFLTVTGKQDASEPKIDDVRPRVRDDVLKTKAVDAARQRASAVAASMKSGDFNAAAKAAGLEVKTTELIARGAPVSDAGVSPAIDAAAFALPSGGVSDAITTDTGAVVVKVLERKDPTADEIKAGLSQTRDQVLSERRGRFYAAYMTKARERMKVNVNRQRIAQVVG